MVFLVAFIQFCVFYLDIGAWIGIVNFCFLWLLLSLCGSHLCLCVPKVMRIVEAMESKGCRLPLVKGEADLAEKLAAITRQVHVLWPSSFGRNVSCP